VFFDTDEALAAGDTDILRDVYERAGTADPTLVSVGGGDSVDVCTVPSQVVACGILVSDTGGRVFLNTDAPLVPGDADAAFDVYERTNGVTTLITGSGGPQDAVLHAISADTGRVFFDTEESLAGDTDGGALDVFRAFFVAPPPPAPPVQPSTGGQGGSGVQSGGSVQALSVTASASRRQSIISQGGVIVIVTCNKPCQASAKGTINVPGASKVFRLRAAKRSLKEGKRTQLRLRLAGKARKAVSRALKRKRKLRAKVSLTTTDAGGAKRTSRFTIRLTR
jgi:hypothetical protein